MQKLKVLLLAFLLLSVAAGQEDERRTYTQKVVAGLSTTVSAPAMRRYWAFAGLSVLASLSLDQATKQFATDQGLMPESLARVAYQWGGGWSEIGILPGIIVVEALRGSPRAEIGRRLEFAFTSLVVVGISTEIIKAVIGRPRPDKTARTSFPYGHSFPSGHASATFAIAEVIRTLYGNGPGAVFYALATVTGLSRIHDNAHYLSDVVAGAGLGVGVVRGFAMAAQPLGASSSGSVNVSRWRVTFVFAL
ncbi:MAG: phosphatase PAP2 family protein [Candidatus Marinimicrobia bacterium]|nr:phosphatase PAP2 family protein [Candidatus Neomarinimicrobiota bacterium]